MCCSIVLRMLCRQRYAKYAAMPLLCLLVASCSLHCVILLVGVQVDELADHSLAKKSPGPYPGSSGGASSDLLLSLAAAVTWSYADSVRRQPGVPMT
jgi:hypothetical protein